MERLSDLIAHGLLTPPEAFACRALVAQRSDLSDVGAAVALGYVRQVDDHLERGWTFEPLH